MLAALRGEKACQLAPFFGRRAKTAPIWCGFQNLSSILLTRFVIGGQGTMPAQRSIQDGRLGLVPASIEEIKRKAYVQGAQIVFQTFENGSVVASVRERSKWTTCICWSRMRYQR